MHGWQIHGHHVVVLFTDRKEFWRKCCNNSVYIPVSISNQEKRREGDNNYKWHPLSITSLLSPFVQFLSFCPVMCECFPSFLPLIHPSHSSLSFLTWGWWLSCVLLSSVITTVTSLITRVLFSPRNTCWWHKRRGRDISAFFSKEIVMNRTRLELKYYLYNNYLNKWTTGRDDSLDLPLYRHHWLGNWIPDAFFFFHHDFLSPDKHDYTWRWLKSCLHCSMSRIVHHPSIIEWSVH